MLRRTPGIYLARHGPDRLVEMSPYWSYGSVCAWAQSKPGTDNNRQPYWPFLDRIMFMQENVADSEMKDLGYTIWMDFFIIWCFSTFSCERGWLAAGELKIYHSIKYLSYNTRACSKFIVVHCAFQVLNWGAWSYTSVSNIFFFLLFQKTKLKLAGHVVNPHGIFQTSALR